MHGAPPTTSLTVLAPNRRRFLKYIGVVVALPILPLDVFLPAAVTVAPKYPHWKSAVSPAKPAKLTIEMMNKMVEQAEALSAYPLDTIYFMDSVTYPRSFNLVCDLPQANAKITNIGKL